MMAGDFVHPKDTAVQAVSRQHDNPKRTRKKAATTTETTTVSAMRKLENVPRKKRKWQRRKLNAKQTLSAPCGQLTEPMLLIKVCFKMGVAALHERRQSLAAIGWHMRQNGLPRPTRQNSSSSSSRIDSNPASRETHHIGMNARVILLLASLAKWLLRRKGRILPIVDTSCRM